MIRRRILTVLFLLSLCLGLAAQSPQAATPAEPQATHKYAVKYGANPAAGHTFVHDGVKLYYEVYGAGQPLLMVHGNGASIGSMSAQIDYFRKRYKVIAMDSRDHGKSGDSDKITYELMADDLSALLDHLKTGPVDVLGWSDGGIEALLLGMRHPAQVKMIASMAANLTPDGLHPDILALIHSWIDEMPAAEKETPAGKRELKVTEMLLVEPQIQFSALETITAPTLILASDHDGIRDEHTVEIYHHIANSQLVIFPNATHMIPYDDPVRFNTTVERFFSTPFVKKDRVKDLMKSLEAVKAAG